MKISATSKTSNTFYGVDLLVIDPCYVLSPSVCPNDEWSEVCDAIEKAGTIAIDDIEVLYTQTKHGDGVYPVHARGQEVGKASVDSGLLSVWKVNNALKINPDLDLKLGVLVPIATGKVSVDGDEGMIRGAVRCNTDEEW